MDFEIFPASNYSLPDLVRLLNRGFEEYLIPIQFTTDLFSNMLRKDGIDLADSRVLVADDLACGIALIACRRARRTSRLAAMGVAKGTRGKGAGSWFMKKLMDEACERGDREMVLEVIEQNEPAVKLYQNYGFERLRRLVGFNLSGKDAEAKENDPGDLGAIDLRDMGKLISQYGLPDLPWQLSGESIMQMNPLPQAYRSGQAYIVLSNPKAKHVAIWSLLVEPEARGKGLGTEMLKRVITRHAGKIWHVPALYPEEIDKVFERAGFEKENLSQWQMRANLCTSAH
jgi:ribosomal protein S18 acetylase RimI-like enzyme